MYANKFCSFFLESWGKNPCLIGMDDLKAYLKIIRDRGLKISSQQKVFHILIGLLCVYGRRGHDGVQSHRTFQATVSTVAEAARAVRYRMSEAETFFSQLVKPTPPPARNPERELFMAFMPRSIASDVLLNWASVLCLWNSVDTPHRADTTLDPRARLACRALAMSSRYWANSATALEVIAPTQG